MIIYKYVADLSVKRGGKVKGGNMANKIKMVTVSYVDNEDGHPLPYCWSVHCDGVSRMYRHANDDSTPIWADELPKYVYEWLKKADFVKRWELGERHYSYTYRKEVTTK